MAPPHQRIGELLSGHHGALGLLTACAIVRGARLPRLSIGEIQRLVCVRYNLPTDSMFSRQRVRRIARPRQVAMYLSHRVAGRSLHLVGRHFGNRHHTTVLEAVRRIEALRLTHPEIDAAVVELAAELGGGVQ